jgi:hypothetical protein
VVHDDKPVGLDGLQDAGVVLVATLARRLGIEALAGTMVRWQRTQPGAANAGRKVMALVFAMVLGADSIDDCEVVRVGRTRRLLGGWMPAPSTLGTFCVRLPSGMSDSSRCWAKRWSARGRPAPVRARAGW